MLSVLILSTAAHSKLTSNIHPRIAHTTCILSLQPLAVKHSQTLVIHHSFPSTTCFCRSSVTPKATTHEYMQIHESHYVSDLPLV